MRFVHIALCVTMFVAAGLVARPAVAQLQITEIMFDPSSSETRWEWFEVYNPTATDIDLDGYWIDNLGAAPSQETLVAGDGGIPPSIISASNTDPRYTSVSIRSLNTIVPAGGVAVIFDGDALDVNGMASELRFRAAWGLENSPEVHLISADFFVALPNTGTNRNFGLWASQTDMYADTDTGMGGTIESFDNAAGSINYSSGFPGGNNAASIAWSGTPSATNGSNWQRSEVGINGAYQSTMTFIPGIGNINAADIGNPGIVHGGTPSQDLLITEIMSNPLSPDPQWEWIELYNSSGSAIDLTGFVLDDNKDPSLLAANIAGGSIGAGETAILFDGGSNSVENMQAAWGESLNFVPIDNWGSTIDLTNSGETIGLWASFADYMNETLDPSSARTFAEAVVALTYSGSGPWPSTSATGNAKSIFLGNLSLDFTDGANWTRSEDGMNGSFTATLVPATTENPDNNGNDIGSPGFIPEIVTGAGDFNGDGYVDAADYTVWRDNLGAADTALFNGSADNTNGLATVDGDDYLLWRSNFGTVITSGGSLNLGPGTTVPEPASLVGAALAVVGGLLVRRRTA